MFSFVNSAQTRMHELEMVVTLAEQVVLALEQTAHAPGPEKKRLALQMLVDLAHSHGIDPPVLLLHTAIEAAVQLARRKTTY